MTHYLVLIPNSEPYGCPSSSQSGTPSSSQSTLRNDYVSQVVSDSEHKKSDGKEYQKFFTIKKANGKKDKEASCNICKTPLKMTNGSTSGLLNHLRTMHKGPKEAPDVKQIVKDSSISINSALMARLKRN